MEPIFPKDFNYKKIEVMDTPSEDLSRFFDQAVKWIANIIHN